MAQATTATLKIERGVPLPHKGLSNENAATIKKMKVGDSVLLTERRRAQAFAASINAFHRGGAYRGSMRAVDGGYRVWVVKRANGAAS